MQVPESYHEQYIKVILGDHEAIIQDKFDLCQTDTLMYKIALKSQEPIYFRQFKIPYAHWKEVERHMLEWLKIGVIQLAHSPIFAVMKKDSSVHLVQDFWVINQES